MSRPLAVIGVLVISLVALSVFQPKLAPLHTFLGNWVAVPALMLVGIPGVIVYRLLTRRSVGRKQTKSTSIAAGIYVLSLGVLALLPHIFLQSIVVPRRINLAEKTAIEAALGFRICIQEAGPVQTVFFLRGEGRKEKLQAALANR